MDERYAPGLGLGGKLAEHVGKLADAPWRQSHPPRNAGCPLGLTAAKLRHDARAGSHALLDQPVPHKLPVRMNDRAAVNRETLGHGSLGREPRRFRQGPGQYRLAEMLVDLTVERDDRVAIEFR